jgi:hypothetical protein
MQSSLSKYYKQSPGLVFKAWVVEHLNNFAYKVKEWLISDIINDFEKRNLYFLNELDKANELSAIAAKSKLTNLNRTLQLLEKLDKSISHIPSKDLSDSFKSLKKLVYRFEARLHRISVSENPIIETPEDLKVQISTMGINSIN